MATITFTPNEELVAHAILDRFEGGAMAVTERDCLAEAGHTGDSRLFLRTARKISDAATRTAGYPLMRRIGGDAWETATVDADMLAWLNA